MIARRDHIAGAAFAIGGALVYAAGGDLPFGTLASPGPGMLPTLAIAIMMLFALIIFAQAGDSPPLRTISWSDGRHALRVVAAAAATIAAYQQAGFLLAIGVMLFVLVFAVERKGLVRSVAFSIGVTLATYVLFVYFLKAPLPRGLLGF